MGGPVSIPSRGFWFFEARLTKCYRSKSLTVRFQSPRGDFGFLKTEGVDEDQE